MFLSFMFSFFVVFFRMVVVFSLGGFISLCSQVMFILFAVVSAVYGDSGSLCDCCVGIVVLTFLAVGFISLCGGFVAPLGPSAEPSRLERSDILHPHWLLRDPCCQVNFSQQKLNSSQTKTPSPLSASTQVRPPISNLH